MKLRTMITGAILTLSLLAASATTAFAAVPRGRLEKVSDSAITGWAYNKDLPDSPIDCTVAVFHKATGEEVFRQRVTAGEYREKLESQGKGNGCHGFTIPMDWSSLPDGEYRVEGYVGDSDFANTMNHTKGDPQAQAQAQKTAGNQNLIPLGVFKTTGYCPCRACSEGWGRHTCTGAIAAASHTVAVDPKVIPFGSKLMINGVVYTAEDRGGGVRGNHIDIFFNTHGETLQHGTQNAEVYLIPSQA